MMELIAALEQGKPKLITLQNGAIVKITKLTIADGELDALYEILSTIPGETYVAMSELHFIYKNFVNTFELHDFLKKYYKPAKEEHH
jgi:hypothetical protein